MDQNTANQNCHNTKEIQKEGEGLRQEPSSKTSSVEILDQADFKTTAEDGETLASNTLQSGDFQKEIEKAKIGWEDYKSFQAIKVVNMKGKNCTLMIEKSDTDITENRIVSTQIVPTLKSLAPACSTKLKCENNLIYSLSSNGRFNKDQMKYAVLNEDDDWDIYQPGMIHSTESSLESRFSFENGISPNERNVSKNNLASSVDSDACQRARPYVGRRTNYSPSSSSANNAGTFPDWNEDRMQKEVKLFFLAKPVRVTPLRGREKWKSILTSPYFSWSFAKKHGLRLSQTATSIRNLKLIADITPEWRLSKAYEIIREMKISRRDYSNYIYMVIHKSPDASPLEWYEERRLDPSLILHFDIILDLVGPDILSLIGGKLPAAGSEARAHFLDQELLDENRFWTLLRKCGALYREQDMDTQTNTDFPSTRSRTHVSSTPTLDASNSNPLSDSLQGHSNKTNETPDTTPIILPHIPKTLDQNDEISRKGQLVELMDSQNGSRSSLQTSEEHQSGKAFNVLKDISNMNGKQKKRILKSDDSKRSKKIRLQENSNSGETKPTTDKSPIKMNPNTPLKISGLNKN